MELLTDRYAENISGVLSCFDRVVIQGTLPGFCFAGGMSLFLSRNNIRIFDYPRFAEPLRNALRDNAELIAKENGLEIDFIRKKNFRKEKRIQDIIKSRGDHPGMVHIYSLRWSHAKVINHGMTKTPIIPISNPMTENVYTIIFTLLMKSWD